MCTDRVTQCSRCGTSGFQEQGQQNSVGLAALNVFYSLLYYIYIILLSMHWKFGLGLGRWTDGGCMPEVRGRSSVSHSVPILKCPPNYKFILGFTCLLVRQLFWGEILEAMFKPLPFILSSWNFERLCHTDDHAVIIQMVTVADFLLWLSHLEKYAFFFTR